MHLYFLRHGEADWPDWKKPDDQRPLTRHGKKEMHEIGKFLARLKVKPSVILTSPLPRASQTAEIAAGHLKMKCREEELLRPGFDRRELEQVLEKYPEESVMLVGHEPDFSGAIAALTGGSVKLSKAGLALMDVDLPAGNARLLWLAPPKIMKK
jgi:phosphohistidine phosphatase